MAHSSSLVSASRASSSIADRSLVDLLAMVARSPPHARARLEELVDRAGGLETLASADPFEIAAHLGGFDLDAFDPIEREGLALRRRRQPRREVAALHASAEALAASFELGRRAAIVRARVPLRLSSPKHVAAWAIPRIGALAHEEAWVLALDGRNHLRAARCVARGGLHGATMRASDPIRVALRVDASAFVLVHNHPSGDPTPSEEDIELTAYLAAASVVAKSHSSITSS